MQPQSKSINLPEWVEAIRKRPAMYFGCGGPRAIANMALDFIRAAIDNAPKTYGGPVVVSVDKRIISINFHDLTDQIFSPNAFSLWTANRHSISKTDWNKLSPTQRKSCHSGTTLLFTVGASNYFEITESKDGKTSCLSMQRNESLQSHSSQRSKEKFIRVSFTPDPKIFGSPNHDQFYEIAGGLRDLSLLRRGLTTVLQFKVGSNHQREIQYLYEKGLESYVFEESGSRIPLFNGVLNASAHRNDMKFECSIRFVHAGVPRIRTWVNFAPSQGGAHLEGLGQALYQLFGKDYGGCRTHPLITNPDSGEKVMVPYSFIGAMHLQTSFPRFQGPTRDVLIGDDLKDFVFQAAKRQFANQWPILQTKRAL